MSPILLVCLLLGYLIMSSSCRAATVTVPLIKDAFAIYCHIGVGTPAQSIAPQVDTGSPDLWVPLPDCPCADSENAKYDPTKSATVSVSEQGYVPFELDYGGEGVRGNPVNDTVRIGGMSLVNQSFAGVLDIVYGDFLTVILGLSFPVTNGTFIGGDPLFWNMVNRKLLDINQFSIWLNPTGSNAVAGEIMFGGVNPARYSGELNILSTPTSNYWRVNASNIHWGNQTILSKPGSAVFDSGTTGIELTTEQWQSLHELAPELSSPCDLSVLPNISFSLGGKVYPITPSVYVVNPADADPLQWPKLGGCHTYIGGPYAGDNTGMIILGLPFFRQYFMTFSYLGTSCSRGNGNCLGEAEIGIATPVSQPVAVAPAPMMSQPIAAAPAPRMSQTVAAAPARMASAKEARYQRVQR
ncbi:hypothetical protein ABBQ38_005417 [Trebouxia sp. C0009 RCD-2024]